MVAVEAGYHQAPLADPAEGLLEAHHAAEGAGQAHRAAQVGAQGREGYAGSHVGTAAATGAARNVVEVPGVVDGAVVGIVGGGAGGELLQVLLAQHYGPGIFTQADHLGVFVGYVVGQDQGTHGRTNAPGGEVVLDADGDAVQGPAVLAVGQFRLQLAGPVHRPLVQQGDEGVELRL